MAVRIGRRAFLGQSAVLAAVAGGVESLEAAQSKGAAPSNIIWMVADGMSAGVLPLAEHFSRIARNKGTIWQALRSRSGVAHAAMDMAALDSIVTDSSSASSSWGSGSRIFNAWVNVLPDGTKLTPIAALAHDKGKRVGLVTTTTVTHATPAGFAAVSRRRDDEALIAEQYMNVCDVVLGGGARFFDAAARRDKRDLFGDYAKAGFTVVRKKAELASAGSSKLLGIFTDGYIPFTLDHKNDEKLRAEVPTLAEMTQAALERLAKSPKGFLLQVEGGRVDHAAHNNDAAALVWEQLAFDDAIEVVLRFAEKHPDTLVVMTTDHGNSNPGLNGMGTEYRDSNACLQRLLTATQSFALITPKLEKRATGEAPAEGSEAAAAPRGARYVRPSAELVKEVTSAAWGYDLTAAEIEQVRNGAERVRQSMNRQFDSLVGTLGEVASNHNGVGWTGVSHTSDYSTVTALGAGAQRFEGFLRNTDIFPILCDFMGIKYRNPSMTPEKAKQYRAAIVSPNAPHWV